MWLPMIKYTLSNVGSQLLWTSFPHLVMCLHLRVCMIPKTVLNIYSLRLALFSCLMLAPGCLALMGPDCSSWGAPNLGTTLRSQLNNAIGFLLRCNVVQGNLTMSRLLVKLHAYMIMHMPYMNEYLCNLACKLVSKVGIGLHHCCCSAWFLCHRATTEHTFVQLLPVAMVSRKNLLCILSHKKMLCYMHAWLVVGQWQLFMYAGICCELVDDVLWTSDTKTAASSIKLALGFRS